MSALVVGWGNPIAGDDAVGLKAADAVAERVVEERLGGIDVIVTSEGGLRLAERTLGYERVLVLDARIGDAADETLSIERIAPRDGETAASATRHDGSLADALGVLRALRSTQLPAEVVLLSVPIEAPTAWSEEMSKTADAAAARLADAALRELEGIALG